MSSSTGGSIFVYGMENSEPKEKDLIGRVFSEEELDEISGSPVKLSEEENLSLEYEDFNLICSTDTPSFDEVSEIEEINETPFWVVGEQVYNEFQWSDSDPSEVDFELSAKLSGASNPSATDSGSRKRNKIKYLKIKSGDLVEKIRVNFSDLSNNYLDKVKRFENYKKILKMIGRIVEKGDDAPVIVTPDESELQGLTEEEKAVKREMWQKELATIEEEIHTLREVLKSKLRDSQELKRKLGISVWKEITDDISHGVKSVKESNVYQNVEEKISQLGRAVTEAPIYHKTESMVKATADTTRTLIGGLTGGFTLKIGQLKNSESFKSFEEKVGSAYENVKTKVSSRSSSVQSFSDALRLESNSVTSPIIPEGKPLP